MANSRDVIEAGSDLQELYIPPPGTPKQIDVVAVHGLGGHYLNTWTHVPSRGNGDVTLWLRDLLPQKLPNAHVMSFSYDSAIYSRADQSVRATAGKLVQLLRNIREEYEDENRPIVFIGHSLGGIIIKQALKHAKDKRPRFSDIHTNTTGLIFFATPHRGADAARWAAIVMDIASSMSLRPSSGFLNALQTDSETLLSVSEDFLPLAGSVQLVSFWEEHTHPVLGKPVVDKSSAVMGLPNEEVMMLGGNHQAICRFGVGDRRFDPVWRAIRRSAKKLSPGLF
ncbi:Alpha/Beta hydrolase protein [Dichotomopilus funicola]|uniref:Alpha/Beta hydrolase protein n=1 Tax=Dichotomopilus funicola TaxID=1934379 RepID=A0AAN6UXR6_9PEZI|nr:Alpha/Beta hydrolase protein [Dichotomopilus funicola]